MACLLRPNSRDDFEVAIICALSIERNAVEALLDEEYEADGFSYGKTAGDSNAYTTGRLGNQHVVLAYMPGMGMVSAAAVASNIRCSFERIKVGIVVGVCGGVPRTADGVEILLGDVIISTSVIQIDFGRQYPNKFIRKDRVEDTLGRANPEIQAFVGKASGNLVRGRLKEKTSIFSAQICAKDGFYNSTYPGPENDKIYPSDYRHKHQKRDSCIICGNSQKQDDEVCEFALQSSCAELGCDDRLLVERNRIQKAMGLLPDGWPITIASEVQKAFIHFGRIACSNRVMKSGRHRDRIAADEGVIAFEMESAGTWDYIPTIMVKSVCDYADGHKNKKWQEYAAATAAACTKALLEEWRAVDRLIPGQKTVKDDAFKKLLSPSTLEVEAQLLANRSQRADGTLRWVLNLDEFKTWRVGKIKKSSSVPAQTLWLTGLPGTGKSTISAYLHDLLVQQYPENIVLYFFCKSGTPRLMAAHSLVQTLCYQLTEKDSFYRRFLQAMPTLPKEGGCENIVLLFNKLLREPLLKGPQTSDIFILLDGLDELEDTARSTGHSSYSSKTEIEALLEQLVLLPSVKLLVTSRSSPELKKILSESCITRSITWGDNTEDIKRYVKSRVEKSPKLANGFQQIKKDPVQLLGKKANGIFLWAAVVLDMLERAVSSKEFSSTLKEVPPTINNVYDQILERGQQRGNIDWIKEILGWTLIVPSPFTIQQMKTAVESSKNDEILDMEDFLRGECGSLLDLVPVLGSAVGHSFEIHIGHETFHAYLTNLHNELFSSKVAHGKALLGCLRYLTSNKPQADERFHLYAITRWRWHLRLSMGLKERGFGEPLSASLEGGLPLPAELAQQVSVMLYKFLTTSKVDAWLNHYLRDENLHHDTDQEVYHPCIEVSAWYETNRSVLEDPVKLAEPGIDLTSFISWCDALPDLQVIAGSLWPRACHVWLWNTWPSWDAVIWGYEAIEKLDIWTNHPGINDENDRARQLLKDEEQVVKDNESRTLKLCSPLNHNLSIRHANFYLISCDEIGSRDHFVSIAAAGGCDKMSGVCQSNLSIACFFMIHRNDPLKDLLLKESMARIQEAIDEDLDRNPRNYEHLGRLCSYQDKNELALEAWKKGISIDRDDLTNCRQKYYLLKTGILTKESYGCETTNYDAAIALLDEAIKIDPAHASQWFDEIVDMYKAKGDLEGARRAYRDAMEFDQGCNSLWVKLAETYIDEKLFEDERQFDWRSYCNALASATRADPSHADSYWSSWREKGMELEEIQLFDIAIDILQYGVKVASQTNSAIEARSLFELNLGETSCSMARWETAITYLEEGLKHHPGKPCLDNFKFLGHAYMSCGRYEEALTAFNKTVEDESDWAYGHAQIGEILLVSGNACKAIKEYKTAIRLCEKVVTERGERRENEGKLDEYLADLYQDLGIVYERLSRPEQARSCFQKALPHAEYGADLAFKDRRRHVSYQMAVHRSEGRALQKLAWLYERLDPGDKRAEEAYEKAVWVFKTAVWEEDDFLEKSECEQAEAALERIRRGESWVFPGEDIDRELRARARARGYRSNWGVILDENGLRISEKHRPL